MQPVSASALMPAPWTAPAPEIRCRPFPMEFLSARKDTVAKNGVAQHQKYSFFVNGGVGEKTNC